MFEFKRGYTNRYASIQEVIQRSELSEGTKTKAEKRKFFET